MMNCHTGIGANKSATIGRGVLVGDRAMFNITLGTTMKLFIFIRLNKKNLRFWVIYFWTAELTIELRIIIIIHYRNISAHPTVMRRSAFHRVTKDASVKSFHWKLNRKVYFQRYNLHVGSNYIMVRLRIK